MTGPVDLRSDTVTRPTGAMRAAMAAAEVGDDVYGEDPTVRHLESLAAALLDKEAAVLVPSGTMGNQMALRVLADPGTEALCAARAHVYRSEAAGAAMNAGVQMRPLPDPSGVLAPEDVAAAFPRAAHEGPPISLLCIENTHMPASGRPWSRDEVAAVARVAHDRGVPVHCDGARIWNAAIATGSPPATLVADTDTVMFCLSKGLGAPVGSLLCGTEAAMQEARRHRHRLGGAMRQAGVLAAAGLVALETMVDRLAEDHERARVLAAALATRFPGSVDADGVRTNIVCCDAAALPDDPVGRLRTEGVLVGMLDARTLRMVTHADVDDDGIARAIGALDALAAGV